MKATTRHAVLAFLLLAPLVGAQTRQGHGLTLDVGGISLQLGMQQDDALKRLMSVYEVRHQDSVAGLWLVYRKGGPPYEVVGNVTFRDQVLMFISRNWASDQTANGLALPLHSALQSVSKESPVCNVSMNSAGNVNFTVFQCGRHRFNVSGSSDRSNEAGISESVSAF